MYPRQILEFFSINEIKEIADLLSKYFPLVSAGRIFDLILQVDSLDTALRLLIIHRESELTIDFLVFSYLQGKDNGCY